MPVSNSTSLYDPVIKASCSGIIAGAITPSSFPQINRVGQLIDFAKLASTTLTQTPIHIRFTAAAAASVSPQLSENLPVGRFGKTQRFLNCSRRQVYKMVKIDRIEEGQARYNILLLNKI